MPLFFLTPLCTMSIELSALFFLILFLAYFHQAIQESGAVLFFFEGSLGVFNQNFLFAQEACNYTIDQWNSANYTALKNCLVNITSNVRSDTKKAVSKLDPGFIPD